MDLGLQGKNIFVTGASRGIGLRIARIFAEEGANIAFCARHAEGVDATAAELEQKGVEVVGHVADLGGDGASLKQAIEASAQKLGGLDILVQNVSAMAVGPTEADWEKSFQTDILGTIRSVDACLPYLEQSTAAAIVVVGTTAAISGTGGPQPYGAMKAGLLHYVSGLAHSLAAKQIRANTVSPSSVYFEGGVWHRVKEHMPERFEQTIARNPSGRMATPEEVAKAVVYLASPCASFITGVNLVVDGGLTQRVQF